MQRGIIPPFSTVYSCIMPASRNFLKLCWHNRHKPRWSMCRAWGWHACQPHSSTSPTTHTHTFVAHKIADDNRVCTQFITSITIGFVPPGGKHCSRSLHCQASLTCHDRDHPLTTQMKKMMHGKPLVLFIFFSLSVVAITAFTEW